MTNPFEKVEHDEYDPADDNQDESENDVTVPDLRDEDDELDAAP